jgi:hypothetical protein
MLWWYVVYMEGLIRNQRIDEIGVVRAVGA